MWLSYNGIWWLCHGNVFSSITCHHFIFHISLKEKENISKQKKKVIEKYPQSIFLQNQTKSNICTENFGNLDQFKHFERRTQFPAYLSLTRIWGETSKRAWVLLVMMWCFALEAGHSHKVTVGKLFSAKIHCNFDEV